jgi:hypothetical protein
MIPSATARQTHTIIGWLSAVISVGIFSFCTHCAVQQEVHKLAGSKERVIVVYCRSHPHSRSHPRASLSPLPFASLLSPTPPPLPRGEGSQTQVACSRHEIAGGAECSGDESLTGRAGAHTWPWSFWKRRATRCSISAGSSRHLVCMCTCQCLPASLSLPLSLPRSLPRALPPLPPSLFPLSSL